MGKLLLNLEESQCTKRKGERSHAIHNFIEINNRQRQALEHGKN